MQPKQAQYRPGSNLPKPAKPTAMKAGALPAPAKPKTALQKLAVRTDTLSNPGVTSRTQREKEEDAYIAYLESKLGWRKGGKKTSTYGSGLGDDGLDGAFNSYMVRTSTRLTTISSSSPWSPELLGGLEASAELGGVEGERESESESDVDNDGEETGEEEMGEEFNEDEEEDNAPELFEPGSDSAEGEDADSEVDNGEKDWNGIEHAASDTGQSQNTAPAITSTNTSAHIMYTFLAFADEYLPVSRYIAPALRNRIIDGSQESAEFTKLKRQVKGQLNRYFILGSSPCATEASQFE